jgi:hypothetical protein
MRRFSFLPCLMLALLFSGLSADFARAQDAVAISFPRPGDAVRGEITVRYTGIPDGGYAVIKIDNNFVTATSQNSFVLNTFPPTFPGDGTHKISITGINAGGKAVGSAEVSFEVANNRVDVDAGSTPLEHWIPSDRLDPNVQRYRVFAVSDGMMEGGGKEGGGGGAGGAGGAGAEGGEEWIPAPLDWQVSALMRRVVRDVGMFSDDKADGVSSANIRTVVQTAFQRQRQSEGSSGQAVETPGAGGTRTSRRRKKKNQAPTKAPWKDTWEVADETGQYFVKMIEPSGREINATRKAPTIALADLLPTFPTTPVSPGSTWETRMTFLGELSSREPVNVSVPITFTSFEPIQTPAGFTRRAAKLESRFLMPEDLAKRIAINLILQGGDSASGGAGGATGGGMDANVGATGKAGTTASSLDPLDLKDYMDSITSIRTNTSRVLWFDVEKHRVLRSEDTMRTYFEYEPLEGEEGGGGRGGGGGGEAAAAEPTKVSYSLTVTTWFDDSVPSPTDKYGGGAGTAHSRDNAQDPTIEKINKPVAP